MINNPYNYYNINQKLNDTIDLRYIFKFKMNKEWRCQIIMKRLVKN
ncbi:hypothetical protein SCORR_v1c07480 [Spiroplasma corruscae]|uniref:Uncharacterized protein n=1 Tax=Spiroplasma corruscae TaxID=216934 RepID=A0A222EPR3_9MOLU|nr:hypothetical protein SCORR_v1c07480 [Spiroplasma corruscae]